MPFEMSNLPPISHFDYGELEAQQTLCECLLCQAYRDTFETYNAQLKLCRGHSRSCSCYHCVEKNATRLEYLAALCKRDTYCELSYHAHNHKLGSQFLAWLFDKMQDKQYHSEAWWAIRAPSRSIAEWLIEWQVKYLPIAVWEVSGIYDTTPEIIGTAIVLP